MGFRNIQVYPFLRLSGGTMTGALNMGAQAITSCGDISAANANGFLLENAASTATNPTIVPNRGFATTGIAADSASCRLVAGAAAVMYSNASDTSIANSTSGVFYSGANASAINVVNAATALVSGMSGATVSATNLIPAGAIVLGVVTRVTTLITGASSFDIGDGTTANLWGDDIALGAGTTTTPASFLSTFQPTVYPAATNVVLTANTSNFTAGAVRLVVFYYTMSAPTS